MERKQESVGRNMNLSRDEAITVQLAIDITIASIKEKLPNKEDHIYTSMRQLEDLKAKVGRWLLKP